MTRFLALFVVAWGIFQVVDAQLRRLKGLGRAKKQVDRTSSSGSGAVIRQAGELVPCASCGVHVAQGRAVLSDGSAFCSDRCAERVRSGQVN